MIRLPALALVILATTALAGRQQPGEVTADPVGFVLRSAAELEAAADRLEQTRGDRPMVFETIGSYPGHSAYLVLRGATADAELHATEADLYIARRGRATVVIGGELVEPRDLPRKQRRGSAIRGGVRHALAPGDVVHVPVGVPHQLLVEPGAPFMYVLIKFDEEPLR